MKPEDRITAYLFAHKSHVEFSTIDLVVKDVKLCVFYGMSPISDDDIRKIVVQWASIHAIGLLLPQRAADPSSSAGSGATAAPSDSELIAAVKKAISTVADGVTVGKKGANINVGVTGLTANLKKDDNSASLGLSWTGTLKLDALGLPIPMFGPWLGF